VAAPWIELAPRDADRFPSETRTGDNCQRTGAEN
jgi:hypothetical protein